MSETNTVSPLRQHMIEDMVARKLNPHTQRSHIQSCKRFTTWLKRSPDTATADEIRRFQLHLVEDGASICNRNRIMTGVRFLFRVTLRRHDLAAEIWHIKEPQKLPPVLSPEEVKRVLTMATSLKARAMLTLAYGCGLRASEVVRLRACDIPGSSPGTSEQMIIRVVQSKGRKDRNVMLPAEILDLLRQVGRRGRPGVTPALRRNNAGCFPVALIVKRRGRASSAGCSRRRRKRLGCARRRLFIRCVIPSQPICSRTARTFGWSRRCSDTKSSTRRRAAPRQDDRVARQAIAVASVGSPAPRLVRRAPKQARHFLDK